MAESAIEWTDVTDNIIVAEHGGWWCRRISPGCDNCYAEGINQNSFFGGNGLAYRGAPPVLKLREDVIEGWARQRKPKKHFVASMTDIFGEWVSRDMTFKFLDGMLMAPRQTFQVLTKRPDVMLRETDLWRATHGLDRLPSNIWPGVTVENQEWADKRRGAFGAIPAAIKFVSYEPALGPVNWHGWEFVSQIIGGGESGRNARPAHPDWFLATRDWCAANGKAFFFKQWGEWMLGGPIEADPDFYGGAAFSDPHSGGRAAVGLIEKNPSRYRRLSEEAVLVRAGKEKTGRLLDGREWNEFPGEVAK